MERRNLLCAAGLLALAALPSHGAIYSVGTGQGCTHGSIAAALATAEVNPGGDTIRITRSLGYVAQSVIITTGQTLDLTGGYATCAQASDDGIFTVIDGEGGGEDPVLRITIATGGLVRLAQLKVTGGDENGDGYGGGIYFRGDGRLEIRESQIEFNTGGYGGGIYAEGTGDNAVLSIGANVLINHNVARYSGGGVYVDSMELQLREPGSGMLFNEAQGVGDSGYGGGLMVLSGDRPALAVVSGAGALGLGVAYGNQARFGGGVAVVAGAGSSDEANLRMFSSSASSPVAIKGNFASVSGGGLYVRSDIDVAPVPTLALAVARLWQTDVDDNAAPAGAAIHVAFDTNGLGVSLGGYLYYNVGSPPGGVACPQDGYCGHFRFNEATTATGAVIRVGDDASFEMANAGGGVLFEDNDGGYLLQVVGGSSARAVVRNVVMARNQLAQQLIRVQDGARSVLTDATVAGNTIGAGEVVAVDGDIELRRSILWQPGKTSLTHSEGDLVVTEVVASETASLGGAPAAVVAPPRFVFPESGDFRLRAASPAVDAASADPDDLAGTADRDALGRQRDLRLPIVPRPAGLVRDIGAFERPELLPLLLNGALDDSLDHWVGDTPGSYEFSADNIVGGSGSGSIFVRLNPAPSQQVVAMEQCIHLPGPGTYALNGYGHAVGFTIATRDQLFLRWRYRSDGGEACTDGVPIGEGLHYLTASSAWHRPATAAVIVVPDNEWTPNSSISVALVVSDTSATTAAVSGYFDGITLELQDPPAPPPTGPAVFKDGFEGP